LVHRLGQLTGKPDTSGIHIHPFQNGSYKTAMNELGDTNSDDGVSVISSELRQRTTAAGNVSLLTQKHASSGWHSDICYENIPADYTIMKMYTIPPSGGDTLFASGYEIYDRMSKPWRQFLEGLTATFAQRNPSSPAFFKSSLLDRDFTLYVGERGSPENVGPSLEACHPVVRTNHMTGWKSVFAIGHHVMRINNVTERESAITIEYLRELLIQNHDLQVRYKWRKDDVAVFDNRCTFHAATFDVSDGRRIATRVSSIGEKPFLDLKSTSRRESGWTL